MLCVDCTYRVMKKDSASLVGCGNSCLGVGWNPLDFGCTHFDAIVEDPCDITSISSINERIGILNDLMNTVRNRVSKLEKKHELYHGHED